MGEATNDLQTLRAACNALWPALRKRHWRSAKQSRAISPTGNPRGHNYAPGQIPGPEPTIEILEHTYYLRAIADTTETRLGHGIGIHLDRVAANRALSACTPAQAAEYDEALDQHDLKFQVPFVWKGDRYRRNDKLTRRAAIALQSVLASALIRPLTTEEEMQLFLVEIMRPDEVFLIMERA